MYQYLGGHGRVILSNFLAQCEADGNGYDVFAYDLDEPDFLKVLARDAKAGRPVRMVLDDAPLHTKTGAMEPESAKLLADAGVKIVRGHFKRYAHDKCVIERDSAGNAIRVLTGSANFSVRGLYVQSNSIIAIDDPDAPRRGGNRRTTRRRSRTPNDSSSHARLRRRAGKRPRAAKATRRP